MQWCYCGRHTSQSVKVSRTDGRSVSRSVGPSGQTRPDQTRPDQTRPVSQSVSQSVSQLVSQSVNHWVKQSVWMLKNYSLQCWWVNILSSLNCLYHDLTVYFCFNSPTSLPWRCFSDTLPHLAQCVYEEMSQPLVLVYYCPNPPTSLPCPDGVFPSRASRVKKGAVTALGQYCICVHNVAQAGHEVQNSQVGTHVGGKSKVK